MACAAVGAALVTPTTAAAAEWVVDDDRAQCADAQFTGIQAAVDAAAAGDTVHVCAGVYAAGIVVSKPLTLLGAGPDPAFGTYDPTREAIVRTSYVDGFDLQADGIVLDGFTIVAPRYGVVTSSSFSGYSIRRNYFFDTHDGVVLSTSRSEPTVIEDNRFYAGETPIRGLLRNGRLSRNTFERNGSVTRILAISATIEDNSFIDQPAGLHVAPTSFASIVRNTFSHVGDALFVSFLRDGIVAGNVVGPARGVGIRLSSPGRSRIEENRVSGRTGTGLSIEGGGDNVIYRNFAGDNTGDGIVVAGIRNSVSQNVGFRNGGDGIRLYDNAASNILEYNLADENGAFDCHDDSVGEGTAGTANTWVYNFGDSSFPRNLCRHTPGP